jgi:hypothetical protein
MVFPLSDIDIIPFTLFFVSKVSKSSKVLKLNIYILSSVTTNILSLFIFTFFTGDIKRISLISFAL